MHSLDLANASVPYKGLIAPQGPAADRVWTTFYGGHVRMLAHYGDFMYPEYTRGLEWLAFDPHRIPRAQDIEDAIAPLGWTVAPVTGYLRGETLFGHLAAKRFPLSLPLRSEQFVDHSPMPDFVHDVLGHLPFLFHAPYRAFLGRLARQFLAAPACPREDRLYEAHDRLSTLVNLGASQAAVSAAEAEVASANRAIQVAPSRRSTLSKLYLWSVEFGFLDDGARPARVVGAGILSSKEELAWAVRRPKPALNLGNVNTPFDFTNVQDQYFSFASWNALGDLLAGLA